MPTISKPAIQSQRSAVDLEKIKVGVILRHKAFGLGIVSRLEKGYLFVDFGGNEKKFVSPAALLEGYLSLE